MDPKIEGLGSEKDGKKSVSMALKEHYTATFVSHGANYRGVDWGSAETAELRYSKMLAVMDCHSDQAKIPPTLLDVGCGYGALLAHAEQKGVSLKYTGVDVAEEMIANARGQFPMAEFICADVLTFNPAKQYDFVVCNGILTQKLTASIREMDRFALQLIRKMFGLCRIGLAFNLMTTRVNHFAPNLYYRSPVELLSFCQEEITPKVRLDHAYPLYEYTIYLFR